jgi:6-methylsalicylate decarboxylase
MHCDLFDPKAACAAHGCGITPCHCGTRRNFLKSIAALGAGTVLAAPSVWAQGAPSGQAPLLPNPQRIDVHHHMFPPLLQDAWKKANVRASPIALGWSLEASLAQMDRAGIATAILSVASGDLNLPRLGRDERRRKARLINNYAAKAITDHPGRFGLFAYLPMPDIDGALAEIAYALDIIKADGIALSTRYGKRFLGDPDYRVISDELNRRKAVVYVHTDRPECCYRPNPNRTGQATASPQDLNRTLLSLLFSGTFARTRDVGWIVSYSGASVPRLSDKAEALAKIQLRNAARVLPDGMDFELKRLHYETANAASSPNVAALLKYVPTSQVLFGTDYPFATPAHNLDDLKKAGFSPAELKAIGNENALRLLPRLKRT